MDNDAARGATMNWPGLGLILGAGIGGSLGVLLLQERFYMLAGAGAGLGLVAGAVVDQLRGRTTSDDVSGAGDSDGADR